MLKPIKKLLASTASLALATALFATAPFDLRFDRELAVVSLENSVAFAKDQDRDRDRDDDDDDGGRDRDDDDDDDDDDDLSGKGGGKDRDRDDDSSGRGRGGDDRSDQDDDDDDDQDRGRDGDDRSDRDDDVDDDGDRSRGRGRGSDDDDDNGIEVTFSDGTKIEIENGRFERKDASGRTIEERPARRSDYAKLQQVGTASGGSDRETGNGKFRGGGTLAKLETSGNDIEITYTDGWKEEIENGRYELKDPQNRTVVERRARQSDRARLFKAVR